jgi:hypothetical protein
MSNMVKHNMQDHLTRVSLYLGLRKRKSYYGDNIKYEGIRCACSMGEIIDAYKILVRHQDGNR